MNKKLIACGIIFIALVILILPRSQKIESAQRQEIPVTEVKESQESMIQNTDDTSIDVTQEATTITSEEIKKLRVALPDQRESKAEVGQNHHATPSSIINFATILGSLMEKAFKNVGDADLLIDELGECLMRENAAQSAKALCLSHARKLSKTYPELKLKVEDMEASASNEILRLLNRRDQLMKSQKALRPKQ